MTLELAFEHPGVDLSVKSFEVDEGLSRPFDIRIVAHSPSDDLDLDALIGTKATFRLLEHGVRAWSGIVRAIELAEIESNGVSTYEIALAPELWLLTQREDCRVFQHASGPEMAAQILHEWGLEASFQLDGSRYPALEYRVQYGESDFAFFSRLLEEAGVAFGFPTVDGASSLCVADDWHARERTGGPIRFIDRPDDARGDTVSRVRVSREVRQRRVVLGDHDFRQSTGFRLSGEAGGPDSRLEQYRFAPGAFLVDGRARGDARSLDTDRFDERIGRARAERALAVERAAGHQVTFETTADLAPGVVFSLSGYPRSDLGPARRVLVTEMHLEGANDKETRRRGRATFADVPFAPPLTTPKPRIHGVQSAVVVGPAGHDVHTDAFGRVRVQFAWDRAGRFDDRSSCFLRVSQGWAGGAYGMMALPRVGHEVLVGFLDGDPDQPIVVGRVFNSTSPVPYKLPEEGHVSGWKSAANEGGFNEIRMDDGIGAELLAIQAERDLTTLVKADLDLTVGGSAARRVAVTDTLVVGVSRAAAIGTIDSIAAGAQHTVNVAAGAAMLDMTPNKITLSSGEATLTLEGPNITLDAAAGILLNAASHLTINANAKIQIAAGATVTIEAKDGDVVLQGGPMVRINPEDRRRAAPEDEDLLEDDEDDEEEDDLAAADEGASIHVGELNGGS